MAADTSTARPIRHRPRTTTVFVAAFVAGAVAAVGVNRALDVRLAQAKPQVECEPVFVALRALPAGAPVTVWDVALRDLPKAMVPATALRVNDSFAGHLLKFPLREGQPLISAQLLPPEVVAPVAPVAPETPTAEPDAPESLVEEAFVAPIPAPPAGVRAADPITESRETVTSRPFDDEPDPGVASNAAVETASDIDSETAPVAGPESEREPVASITEVEATAPTPQPEDTPAPQVTASLPTPVATPVEPTPAALPPGGAESSVNLSSDLFAGPAAGPLDATLDMPSRPAASLADLPSVMASGDAASSGPATTGDRGGVRYLVVPERIARQVDTAFTTPAAPEATGAAKAAAQPDRGPAATRPSTSMPPRQQGRSTTPAKQQARPQPAKSATRPGQPAAAANQSSSPRAWGGMFPNVAAGLEAMGSWRSGSRGTPTQTDGNSATR